MKRILCILFKNEVLLKIILILGIIHLILLFFKPINISTDEISGSIEVESRLGSSVEITGSIDVDNRRGSSFSITKD